MTTDDQRRRIGIRDVCARYNRTPVTIWSWYKAGTFPLPHYIQNQRHWWVDELDAFDATEVQTYADRHGGGA